MGYGDISNGGVKIFFENFNSNTFEMLGIGTKFYGT